MNPTLPVSILSLAGTLYFLAFLLHLAAFLGPVERANRWALVLVRVGFLVHTFFFFSEPKAEGLLIPVSTFGQVMGFFSWALAFVYLVLLAGVQSESFGLILAPLLSLFVGVGLLNYDSGSTTVPNPLNPYFVLHLGTAFFAYASFTLSFAAALLYLIQHRALKRKRGGSFYHKLPSLESLERLIYSPMAWGAFLLLGAVGIGLLWSKSAFGKFWLGEPKAVTTMGVALFYLALLYAHYVRSARGKRVIVISLIAFLMIFVSFFGTNLFGGGFHRLLR
ncbi:MAG: cytochrome c biogenesis protein CcsA [Candidatus Omnitrophica bacterium]|nr:cytochrome c biogenesis protein CcsA [Candidatus Omnitrophota bacterium]